jgi:prepilin-type N-terminal cleavage/methylation domain-containing protein
MGDKMRHKTHQKEKGFTLIEAVVGIALVAIAVLGLAEMFTLGVMNNLRSDRITNAGFLAQQQIDLLRNLTNDELATLASSAGIDLNNDGIMDISRDEQVDLNNDSQIDYRRLTQLQYSGTVWEVRILVFSAEKLNTPESQLLQYPEQNKVRAKLSTIISR